MKRLFYEEYPQKSNLTRPKRANPRGSGDRAIRSNLCPAGGGAKDFRFYPFRGSFGLAAIGYKLTDADAARYAKENASFWLGNPGFMPGFPFLSPLSRYVPHPSSFLAFR
jgi:hypothetical protein